VTVHVAERKQVLVVPDVCITRSKGKASVDVADASGNSQTREVEVGLSNWEDTEIVSGLNEGETVIIPPPPGTEPPPWMSSSKSSKNGKGGKGGKGTSDSKSDRAKQTERNRSRMMMQFRK